MKCEAAILGVPVCIGLIYRVENRIFTTAIHHISVGPPHEGGPDTYMRSVNAFRDPGWQSFLGRWSAGFGITGAVISLHLTTVGMYPLACWLPYFAKDARHWFIEAVLAGFASFLVLLVVGTALLFVGVFRYSAELLPWTYRGKEKKDT